MSHLQPDPLPDDETLPVWLGDDPELALARADLNAYADAHPCDCPTLCRCDDEEPPA